ncbi:hypothetical protein LWI28_003691 [Acer negundo]|uniref:Uncharacterized protein n=1 Tax=Acer negundo TaxID=4023 RepID=A0AAD5NZA1_ACENE|nr:hypothetical protein LWI28_003691 [Acer negundo]
METYQTWKRKNSLARIMMLSSMTDAFLCENEDFDIAQDIWIALKDKFGGTSTTKLRRLTIKYDTYRKCQNHDMRRHLREMSNVIRELKSAGENSDRSVTEIEPRDVNFLESEFLKRGEVDRDIRFYELDNMIEDSNLNAPLEVNTDLSGTSVPSGSETPLEVNIDLPGPSVPSGSNEVIETTLLDLPSRRSNHGNVPRRRFEIEGETFMVASHDADEPKNVNNDLKSPDEELWIKAMKEEMDSMKTSHKYTIKHHHCQALSLVRVKDLDVVKDLCLRWRHLSLSLSLSLSVTVISLRPGDGDDPCGTRFFTPRFDSSSLSSVSEPPWRSRFHLQDMRIFGCLI